MTTSAQHPVRTLPGARWTCRSCGQCCRFGDLGPIEPGTLEALVAADPGSFWPAAATRPWHELREGPDGRSLAWLTRHNGGCIFLDVHQRCAIHAALGEDAKPAFCREFPFHLVREHSGFTAVVRPTCAGLQDSRIDGEPIDDRAQALPGLPRAYPVTHFEPDQVVILPGLGLDLAGWTNAEPAILRLLEAPEEDPRQTVAQLRDALARATGRALPVPDDARYQQAVAVTLELLLAALRTIVSPPSDDPRDALPGQAIRWIERAQDSEPAPLDPAAQSYLNLVLRSLIFGRAFHRMGGLPRATGLLLLEQHLGRCAATRSGDRIHAAELAAVLVPWWNLAGHGAVAQALRLAAPALEDIFTHA